MRALLALAVLLLLACKTPIVPPESRVAGLAGATQVVTLTNLRANDGEVSAMNFQAPELIPICSPVTLARAYENQLEFKVNATGRQYAYVNHKGSGEPFDQNLAHYFGRACPDAALTALSPDESAAVKQGVVKPGMSREAVILAIGYPPPRDTRTLELPTWRYWRAGMQWFVVVFGDDGRVEAVR
jgi:hypothetical protein